MTTSAKPELVTEAEVANRLRLSVGQVHHLVATGQLVEIIICGERRYDSADVIALILTYKSVANRRS